MKGKSRKRFFALFVVALLAVCVLGACGSKNMSKEEYIEEVNKLNTVSEEFFNAMTEWVGNAMAMDTEEAKAGVEEMREITKGYGEVAPLSDEEQLAVQTDVMDSITDIAALLEEIQ